MDILHSKLNAPRRYKILHRKRLTRLFSEIFQKKLITVTAGAGFGKTTLVMDALAGLKAVPVWYRLDEQDNDFPVFMSYLYAAVQHHFLKSRDPGIKKPLKKTNLKNQTDLLLDWMVFLEKNAVPNTVLILDDYHLVQDSESINQAIEYILCRLPEYIHLVIISRKNLSLPLSTIRSREQLLEINENDLSFTPGEIKSFYTNIYRLLLTDTHIEDIHSSTRGWAASLVLLQYAFRSKTPKAITKSLKTFKSNPQYIFSYLEENIFNAQPEHIKTFMLKTSLLHEIDTRRCKQFFDMEHADTILKQMIKDHLLIFPVDESETIFYLHHLFRNFLSLKLKQTFSSDKINQLHRKIAIQMEGEDIFLALHHYIEGEMFDEAVRVIKTHEMKFLIEGKTNFLRQCMEKIPKPIIEKNPQLLMAQAKLFSYFGNPGKAVELLTHAHLLFKKQNSTEDMIKCLVELGSQYYFTGHVREAKLLMEQVLDEVEQRSITYVIAMTYLIFLSAVLGEFDVACAYYETAFEVIQDYDDFERRGSIAMLNTSYTSIHYFCGDFELSQKLNKKLLAWMFELNIELGLPLVYYHFAAASFYLNEYEQGMDYAKKGIQVCKKIDLLDSRKAWIYLAYAQNCLGIGKLDKAIKFIDNSIDLFEEPGNRWGLANAWDCLHQIYLAQGKIILAKQILIQAMDIIKGYQLVLTEGILDVSMANIFIIEKDYLPALKHLDRSRTKLKDAAYHLFTNHLLSSRAFFELGKKDKAFKHLSSALSLAQEKSYDHFLIKERGWLPACIKKSPLNRQTNDYLNKIFRNELKHDPAVLKICLLGRFKLSVGKTKIPLSKWKNSKALMILKYLAASRDQGFTPREVLIEMLWPDGDIRKTGKRFNVAMSALRKTLEPDLPAKAPSSYIERKKDAYRLFSDKRNDIDIDAFAQIFYEAKIKTKDSQKAFDLYLKALCLYPGPFLEEDRYENWCIEKRQLFNENYLTALNAILCFLEKNKKYDQAIIYAKKILETDPWDEMIYKKLMNFYASLGNTPNIIKIYHAYLKSAEDLDIPVNSEIEKLYQVLVRG